MMHVVPPLRPSVALGVDASDPRRIVWTLEKASLTRCSATDIRTVLDTWTIKKHPWLVDWFIGDNCIIDQYNGIGIFVMAHMFVLVWPLLLVWCWCGFLLMGSFAGCCLTLEMTCLSHFDDWIKVRSRGKNKDREKARVHCNSLHISLFHIVSYCFILFESAKILEILVVSVSLVEVSPSFRIPMGGQDVEFKLNLFATRLGKRGVGSVCGCALNSHNLRSVSSNRHCVLANFELLYWNIPATGIIRTWPKRNCQRSSANFDDLIRTQ